MTIHTTADGANTPTERLRIGANGTVTLNSGNGHTHATLVLSKADAGAAKLEFDGDCLAASPRTTSLLMDSPQDSTSVESIRSFISPSIVSPVTLSMQTPCTQTICGVILIY